MNRLVLAATIVAGTSLVVSQEAHAWPVVAYDQFDGNFSATCFDAKARLNIIIGTAGINNGVLERLVAVPVSLPLAVTCDNGALEADISVQVNKVEDLCATHHWSPYACDQLLRQLDNLAGIMTATLPPVVKNVSFDWRPNGFTWLLGVNVSNTVLTFAETPTEPARSTTLLHNLIRGNEEVTVTGADGVSTQQWRVDNQHGNYFNIAANAQEYAWNPPKGLAEHCFGGMTLHTHGDIWAGERSTADGVMNVLRSINCALPLPSGKDYLGISISTAVEYRWSGESP